VGCNALSCPQNWYICSIYRLPRTKTALLFYFIFGPGTDPTSLLIIFFFFLFLLLGRRSSKKSKRSVVSSRMVMKFGRLALQVYTHRLKESDIYDAILSSRRPWRPPAARCCMRRVDWKWRTKNDDRAKSILSLFKRSPLVCSFVSCYFIPAFSRPAFSCPAHWSVNFTSVIFTSCIYSAPHAQQCRPAAR